MDHFRRNFALLCVFFVLVCGAEAGMFNVIHHGARGDGRTDNTRAFMETWRLACASPGTTYFIIPRGTFRVGLVQFIGPCKGYINFLVEGIVQADPDPAKFATDSWVVFERISGMTIKGGGTFDGQGALLAWKRNNCAQNLHCHGLPINIRFNFVEYANVTYITSLNSKLFHINLLGCKKIMFQHINIKAPGNSPNTDGIHMGNSQGVSILDSWIGTGDDCISIGSGSVDVNIHGVTCGPGHGISVGSLGKYPNEQNVVGVTVTKCTLIGTMNGVRIKSWPKSYPGAASNMVFDDIIMQNVQNPIVIDQEYCPWNVCDKSVPSKIKISHVRFHNIRGTSSTKNVVSIVCSKGLPCEDVRIGDINVKYTGRDGPATSTCTHTRPILSGLQIPPIHVSY